MGKKAGKGVILYNTKIIQIVDNQNMIVKVEGFKRNFWLEGVKTDELSDGTSFIWHQITEKVGTKQYTTVTGSKATVDHYKITKAAKNVAKLAKELNPKTHTSLLQFWTTKDGKQQLGEFVSYGSGKLSIKDLNGTNIEIKTKDLHKDAKKLAAKIRTAKKKMESGQ